MMPEPTSGHPDSGEISLAAVGDTATIKSEIEKRGTGLISGIDLFLI